MPGQARGVASYSGVIFNHVAVINRATVEWGCFYHWALTQTVSSVFKHRSGSRSSWRPGVRYSKALSFILEVHQGQTCLPRCWWAHHCCTGNAATWQEHRKWSRFSFSTTLGRLHSSVRLRIKCFTWGARACTKNRKLSPQVRLNLKR